MDMKLFKQLKGNKKVVITMPAYNAAKTLRETINEIPKDCYDSIIVCDDASKDQTVEVANTIDEIEHVIIHESNKGYGGNQKSLYDKALEQGADIIILLHPDNQYNPQIIPNLVFPFLMGQADVVFASRFIQDPLKGGPVVGGMPLIKYFANRSLTTIQNWLMGTFFTEFHTGYRAYSRKALESINYQGFSDDFIFDNQIIAPLVHKKLNFHQIGVETRYFKEASSINLLRASKYAIGCLGVAFSYFLHRKGWKKWEFLEAAVEKK